jgi:hypothetical protein
MGWKSSTAGLIAVMAASAPALCQEPVEALEARIAALEAMLAELRAEVDAVREAPEQADDGVIALTAHAAQASPAPAVQAPAATPASRGFMMGGTRVEFGGFIDLDVHVLQTSDGDIASNSIARDFHIPGATPVGGVGDDTPDTDFTAQSTRFFFKTETDTDHGPIRTTLEFDFLGSPGGDERVSNSYNPRLRIAQLSYRGWTAGQGWTTFQNTSAIPESASFLVLTDAMVFNRQALVRYSAGPWSVALENANTMVTPFGGGARINADDNLMPDVVVRYDHRGAFGNVSVSALARELSYEAGGTDSSAFGWGVSAAGRVNVARGDVRFTLTAGEGLGRYLAFNTADAAVLDAAGALHPIASAAGLIAYRREITDRSRINVGYARLEIDNDTSLTGAGVTRSTYSGFFNLMRDVAPGLSLGAEASFGERRLETGETGSITRFTMSSRMTF